MEYLTDKLLEKISYATDPPVEVWDSDVHNFGIKRRKPGEIEFLIRYSLRDWCSQQEKMVIQEHERVFAVWEGENPNPDWKLMNVSMARGHASYLLLQAARNIDPFAEGDGAIGSRVRFAEFLEEFMQKHAEEKNLAPRTVEEYRAMLDNDIKPALGDVPLFRLDRAMIAEFHRNLSVPRPHPDRPHCQRGGRIRANRQLALVKCALARAVEWGYLENNPARYVKKFKERSRDVWGHDDEIIRLLRLLERDGRQEKHRYRNAIDGIRLALLTGARKQELLKAERHLFVFKQSDEGEIAVWRKPPEITKSKQWEITVLTPIAARIVRARLDELPDGRWLFPSRTDPSRPLHDFDGWKRYRKLARCEHLHFHDLRHTASTHAVMNGANLYAISKGLDHKSIKTTERYTHADLRAKAEAAAHFGKNMSRWLAEAVDPPVLNQKLVNS